VVDLQKVIWTALATVGEDWTVDGRYVPFTNAAGDKHPSLRGRFYSDCADIGAVNGRDGNDFAGTLSVSYDGAEVFAPASVQFHRGTFNQTVRYGKQAPWHAVDGSLFPNWATPTVPLPLADLTNYDLSYNGMGVATMQGMGSTGSRPDIAYVPAWDVPFCVQPSDAAYAVVRVAADHSGAWPIYFLDDDTGLPFDIGTYPMVSFLPYKQATFAGNPIAAYSDPAKVTGSPLAWDQAHETGYNFVAAAASGTARDKFHAAVWANAMLTAFNPVYRQQTFTWNHYQERGSAWALRSVFLASYLSAMPEYFTAQLATMLAKVPATNPLCFLADYMRPGANDAPGGPSTGIAIWQENYLRIVVNVVAYKRPEWQPFAAYLGANVMPMLADARYPLSTLYVHTIKDSQGNFLPTWTAVLEATLTGPQGIGTQGAWPAADIAAATDPAITPQALDALIRKNMPGYANNKLGDFVQYANAPDAYPALIRASIPGLVDLNVPGAADAWQVCEAVPTKPDYGTNWAYNIEPRAAA